ncbi:MAG: cation transporter [Cellulosilyticum sp.]|nr:cation transporter [Cellulosilyticum sp.]
MTVFLIKRFIKDYDNVKDFKVREAYGLLGGIVGIIANVFLCTSKIAIGLMSSSIAILADGINNLSDAGSSIVTLIGFKLSSKPADEDHPYGHARIEYLSGLIVSFIILLLGLELIRSSFNKILNPEPLSFSWSMVIVLVLSILTKIWLFLFNRNLGKRINSTTMIATATDSLNDVIATSAVLIALLIAFFTGINLDGYMGIFVGIFIFYSGFNLVKETINPLLGEAPSPELIQNVQQKLMSYPTISGYHDLVLHSYGPNQYFASVHAEVPADAHLLECHDLIDIIEKDFAKELGINLVIHLDPILTNDEKSNALKEQVQSIVSKIDSELSIHDFRLVVGKTHTNIIFDVLVPVHLKMKPTLLAGLIDKEIKKIDDTYYTVITVDTNYVSTSISSYDH